MQIAARGKVSTEWEGKGEEGRWIGTQQHEVAQTPADHVAAPLCVPGGDPMN